MAKNSLKKKKPIKKSGIFTKKRLAIVLLAFISAFAIVYAVSYFQLLNKNHESEKVNAESTEVLMDKMKQMLDDEKKRLVNIPKYTQQKVVPKLPPVIVQKPNEVEKQNDFSEIEDYKKSLQKKEKKPLHVDKTKYSGKPKLAIVIDDVAFAHQVKQIKKIPFKVSPSFFPPTQRHPDTIKLSDEFDFKMIHLPTQAMSYGKPEPKTLNVGDSIETIRERIKNIKSWFPSVQYYNNHTGSKFTSDYDSMDKLLKVMIEEKLYFVDSRTTADTKVPQVAKKYGIKIYSRDIFLDNSSKEELIKKQLKKAVKIAKKRGYAVAIGHPHQNTLKVLIGAKSMLKDVELVYIKDL